MKKMMLAIAVLGVGLAAGAIQARGPAAPVAGTAAAPAVSSAPRTGIVAADGRVVTYPGGEVVVGAERAGRVVRVRVRACAGAISWPSSRATRCARRWPNRGRG
jgi:hypothetical protein